MRSVANLEEIAPLLQAGEDFVLGLPASVVLAQRLRLPTVEPDEFAEMARIQIEKALPYSTEDVTTDFQVIQQDEEGSVISAIAVHNERLAELVEPLLKRALIPKQVTVYAAQRAATHAATGRAFLLYRENGVLVCAITEEGKLSFARTLNGAEPAQLQIDLPQLALSAELQGINTSFPVVLLDESLFELRETVEGLFESRPQLVAVETPPAETTLNLLPLSWRQRRSQIAGQREWRRRIVWAAGAYLGLLLLFLAYYLFLRFEVGRLDRRIARDEPRVELVRTTEANWQALAPAIDPQYYPIEVLLHLSESLPSPDVRITAFNQSARQVSVDGEANSAKLAYDFAEKVKKNPGLQKFQFELAAPRILPNDHAQFRLEGKPR